MAGTAMAHEVPEPISTDYTTEWHTITACPETVTDCPARSTQVSSTVYSTRVHTVTACAESVTDCPARSIYVSTERVPVATPVNPPAGNPANTPAPSAPAETPGAAIPGTVAPSAPGAGVPGTGVPAPPLTTGTPDSCPGYAVSAVTKTYTTVLTTVEYHTVPAPCATGTQGTGVPQPSTGYNTTTPHVPQPTSGAVSLTGSAILAAVAGAAVFILA
ncbi:hypothetical protein E4U53_004765 [Claviceps sorghi]|nr:hypothetical protein E4U53_004765 [Claviceps sorghi]